MRALAALVVVSTAVLGCGRAPPTPARQAELTRLRADELHERAIRLQGDLRWAVRAAQLHVESARLRPPSDPRAYQCYAAAADVLIAAGKVDRAQRIWEDAARLALSKGDSLGAARAYADAVLIEARHGSPRNVLALAERVRAITRTAALPPDAIKSLNAEIARVVEDANDAIRSSTRTPVR